MPYLLKDLVINRVDLVDEGANSAAFIELYKRKEQGKDMDLKDIIEKMTPEHAEVVQAEIDRLNGDVVKAAESVTTLTADLAKACEDLEAANEAEAKAKEELDTLKGAGPAFDEAETLKAMPEAARELFSKMKAQKEAAEEAVRKAKEAEMHAEAIAKASELKAIPVEQDKLIGILKGGSPELIEVLSAINAAIDSSVLGEVGKSHAGSAVGSADDAWGKIEAKAKEIAKNEGISKAKAISRAVDQNPELYKEYLKGGAN